MTARIIVADDHPVFRDGLARLIGAAFPEADIIQAGTVEEVELLAGSGPAPLFFVLDLMFPGMNPAVTVPRMRRRFPTSSLIIVSMLDDEATIRRLSGLGIDGYVAKSIPGEDMVAAIRRVVAGEFVIAAPQAPGFTTARLFDGGLHSLTQRQREILALIGEGASNKAIGRQLDLSPFTVRNHVSLLFRVLGVATRAELAELAREDGLTIAG